MLEMILLSLFVGSLGFQTVLVGGWQQWQQVKQSKQKEEEEEILARHESHDYAGTGTQIPDASSSTTPVDLPHHNNGFPNGAAASVSPPVAAPVDPRLAGWEYKIVRASSPVFRNPAVFQQLCREEAESGWILLEKLDDRRVRFKRPIAMREVLRPEYLSYDPYRCHYGPSSNWGTWLGAIAFLSTTILSAYLGYALVSATLTRNQPPANSLPWKSSSPLPKKVPTSPAPVEPGSGSAN